MSSIKRKLTPSEEIKGISNATVGDFWVWAYSDILSNRNRAIYAEYLVGHTLEVLSKPRIEWDAYDLLYNGKRIEVKTSAYVQSWEQRGKLSNIRFDIALKTPWIEQSNKFAEEKSRNSDLYVFCLFTDTNKQTAPETIMNMNFWEFYVVSTLVLNNLSVKTSLSLTKLKTIAKPLHLAQLKAVIDSINLE